MEWEFSKELLDQIIYCMENQEETYYLDSQTGLLLPDSKENNFQSGGRYHELPQWRSLEGFQLMERFVTTVNNPIFRSELRNALASESGVFRNFKNTVKKREGLERLWYSFKEREMKKVVYEWINQIREIEGLEKLTTPEEDTDELIESDFAFTDNTEKFLDNIIELDRKVFLETYPGIKREQVFDYYKQVRASQPGLCDRESIVIIAETPGGDFTGFAWGIEKENPLIEGTTVELCQLALVDEYQGLGLGQAILMKFIEMAESLGAAKVRINLSGRFLNAVRLFEIKGFRVSSQTMELDLSQWVKEFSD